jgi:hypothetical protein
MCIRMPRVGPVAHVRSLRNKIPIEFFIKFYPDFKVCCFYITITIIYYLEYVIYEILNL